jgi:hypothetical protein
MKNSGANTFCQSSANTFALEVLIRAFLMVTSKSRLNFGARQTASWMPRDGFKTTCVVCLWQEIRTLQLSSRQVRY